MGNNYSCQQYLMIGKYFSFSLAILVLSILLCTCREPSALLLKVRSTQSIESFDLKVKDLASNQIILERIGEKVNTKDPERDISQPGQELKIAIEFAHSGNYLIYILGRRSQGDIPRQFGLKDFQVTAVREENIMLLPLLDNQDNDADGFPACYTSDISCGAVSCAFLDCNDNDDKVNPFAQEICGNGIDEDCSVRCDGDPQDGDIPCVDNDGDGMPIPQDCDDNDPCRSPEINELKNLCKDTKTHERITQDDSFWALPAACLEKLANEGKTWNPPYCGDGIDQNCDGQDEPCTIDEDCDGFPPPADCNDSDPAINPGTPEKCGDNIDNNCDGSIDEICIFCDVDGDGHAVPELATLPADSECKQKGKIFDDTDDYDAGIYPGTTQETGGKEGGTVLGALREYCSYSPSKNNTTQQPLRARDVDHDGDGKAAKDDGCPSEECDKDGDGFPGSQCNPPTSILDCNDNDPHIFPGAPDYCDDGIVQNCSSDMDCSCDKDGDRYCSPADCNDSDPAIYPWAKEICDDKDNDCDGLINEGNPDKSGQLIPTNVPKCNDDNDGLCGPLKGICACSRSIPAGTRDENNRVACVDEDLNAPASPRCFGATPHQTEVCDSLDNACLGAGFVDGQDECPPQGMVCCSNQKQCRDTKNDPNNCGDCDRQCNSAEANRCLNGQCVCGNTGGPCGAGLNCENGQCVCKIGGRCTGCCAGNSCVSGTSVSQCGTGGNACKSCVDNNECTSDACNAGQCNNTALSTTTTCNNNMGKCFQGSCCLGCIGGNACQPGTNNSYCGTGGNNCSTCETANSCKEPSCATGSCVINNKTDNDYCTDGNPCTDGDHCSLGNCIGTWKDCSSVADQCNDGECNGSTGQCVKKPKTGDCTDNLFCTINDSCSNGVCSGDTRNCPATNECNVGVCNETTDQCETQPKPDSTSCQSGTGTCRQGSCCQGCWDGTNCLSGGDNTACGDNGELCKDCMLNNQVCTGQHRCNDAMPL